MKDTNHIPDWLWQIAVDFSELARGREAAVIEQCRTFLNDARQNLEDMKAAVPERGENTLANRNAEREVLASWRKPKPDGSTFAESAALLVATVNAVADSAPPCDVEAAGLLRIEPPCDGLDETVWACLILGPPDWPREMRAIEGAWRRVRERWADSDTGRSRGKHAPQQESVARTARKNGAWVPRAIEFLHDELRLLHDDATYSQLLTVTRIARRVGKAHTTVSRYIKRSAKNSTICVMIDACRKALNEKANPPDAHKYHEEL